ncbi:MAG TPA: hypothetical protein VGD67_16645, partial [Pseudonocardiaceae bacterium]
LTRALELAVRGRARRAECAALNGLAVLRGATGRPGIALRHNAAAVELARRAGDQVVEQVATLSGAWLNLALGRLDTADEIATRARAGFERLGIRYGEALADYLLGCVRNRQHRPADALRLLVEAVARFRRIGAPRYLAQALAELATAHAGLGDRGGERTALTEAARLHEELGLSGAEQVTARLSAPVTTP